MKKARKIIIVTLIALLTFNATAQQSVDPIIDNDTLTLKLDLTRGGAISYLSLSGSTRSIVNIADEGRYIQQSYYAGKSIDRKTEGQSPSWSPWSWNPIQVGDAYRNRAQILDFQKNGDTFYVKCIPIVVCQVGFLTQFQIEEASARWRSDPGQELHILPNACRCRT